MSKPDTSKGTHQTVDRTIVETTPPTESGNEAVVETLFALANGYLGTRGTFEEGGGRNSVEGTYLNGFFEEAPIVYGERFHAFAEKKQSMLNVPNGKVLSISLDDERFDLTCGTVIAYRRTLDMSAGVLRREVTWESPAGRRAEITFERLVHQTKKHLMAIRASVVPLDSKTTTISFCGGIDFAPTQSDHEEDDPRLGTRFGADVLTVRECAHTKTGAYGVCATHATDMALACAYSDRVLGAAPTTVQWSERSSRGYDHRVAASAGEPSVVERRVVYAHSKGEPQERLRETIDRALAEADEVTFDALLAEQHEAMAEFWEAADIVIEGDEPVQQGIRLNMFHLFQSTSRDGSANIAAKGLTGLGYEGHTFWDTETYVLPFFLHTQPHIARALLENRYRMLDHARSRAREMAHRRGALFAWRTIDGRECSASYPTGTAQYHIDADVAFAVKRYYEATGDDEFLARYGAEILCETARLWMEVGGFAEDGSFRIPGVTGPDEYTILVDNNAYTNLMARENLQFAAATMRRLTTDSDDAYRHLAEKIAYSPEEAAAWDAAADRMHIPRDPRRGLIAQDDTFLDKPIWDIAATPPARRPLLLHYHPLVLTRYQVCKQADVVLAELLLHHRVDIDQRRRDFAYYEPLTTHDSSLSACIFGIVASELGEHDKAYRYFAMSVLTDLEDEHGNTNVGIHAANMAGAWQGIVFGFAGLRVGTSAAGPSADGAAPQGTSEPAASAKGEPSPDTPEPTASATGEPAAGGPNAAPGATTAGATIRSPAHDQPPPEVSLRPTLPFHWKRYAFSLRFRGRILRVDVRKGTAQIRLIEGDEIGIRIGERSHRLSPKEPTCVVPVDNSVHAPADTPSFPPAGGSAQASAGTSVPPSGDGTANAPIRE